MTDQSTNGDAGQHDQEIDGCDVAMDQAGATADEQLPIAAGGVASVEDDLGLDGCDVAIHSQGATPDEELPVAYGGVA